MTEKVEQRFLFCSQLACLRVGPGWIDIADGLGAEPSARVAVVDERVEPVVVERIAYRQLLHVRLGQDILHAIPRATCAKVIEGNAEDAKGAEGPKGGGGHLRREKG